MDIQSYTGQLGPLAVVEWLAVVGGGWVVVERRLAVTSLVELVNQGGQHLEALFEV